MTCDTQPARLSRKKMAEGNSKDVVTIHFCQKLRVSASFADALWGRHEFLPLRDDPKGRLLEYWKALIIPDVIRRQTT